jgi:hypothetical protein
MYRNQDNELKIVTQYPSTISINTLKEDDESDSSDSELDKKDKNK